MSEGTIKRVCVFLPYPLRLKKSDYARLLCGFALSPVLLGAGPQEAIIFILFHGGPKGTVFMRISMCKAVFV